MQNRIAITGTPAKEENWTLDQQGNWTTFKEDANGDGSYTGPLDLTQTRYHNAANEIDGNNNNPITELSGQTAWKDPVHDAAGNMTTIPKPSDLAKGFTATYDAWNRLVKIVDETTSQTVAEYEYDPLNRRIVKSVYTSGTLSHQMHFYCPCNVAWMFAIAGR